MLKTMKSNAFKCVALILLLLTVAMVGLVGCGEDELPTVSGVVVSTQPTKLQYEVGEKFDYTGAKLKVTYDDGTTSEINVTASMIDLYSIDFTTTGTKNITVTFTDGNGTSKTTTITVTVVDTLGGKKAEQIKAINDYTALTDSAIVALKASYINSVNAAANVDALASIFDEYKAAVDAYTKASKELADAITAAKAAINAVDISTLPESKKRTAEEHKASALAAVELAGNTTETNGIVDAYKAIVETIKADLDYELKVNAKAVELYTELCEKFRNAELNESKFYNVDAWAEVVAAYDKAKAEVLRADDLDILDDIIPELDEFIENEINTIIDDIYDLIIAFDEAATQYVDELYPFMMYKKGDFADELTAINDAIVAIQTNTALPAEVIASLNAYERDGKTYDLVDMYTDRQNKYNSADAAIVDDLADAYAAAPAVDAAIAAVPAIKTYINMAALGAAVEPDSFVDYTTYESAELAAALTALNDWLYTYDMIWTVDATDDTVLIQATEYADGVIVDPNVREMLENFDILLEVIERAKVLAESDEALAAIKIKDKLDAILINCPLTVKLIHIDDADDLKAIEDAVAAWLEEYDLKINAIYGYDAAEADAYIELLAQREHLDNMFAAKEEYEAENGLKATLEALVAKDDVLYITSKTEIDAANAAVDAWVAKYNVDDCNKELILGANLTKLNDVNARYAQLEAAAAASGTVKAEIKALLDTVAADGGVKLDHYDDVEDVAAVIKAWAEDTNYMVNEPNIALILNEADATYAADLYDDKNEADGVDSYVEVVAALDKVAEEWQKKADKVNEAIDAIGDPITKDSAAAIEDAREALEDFLDEIDPVTDLTDDEIIDFFEIKEDDLLEAEAALVALYIADLGDAYYTRLIPTIIETLDVYFAWAGVDTYNDGTADIVIADALKAANDAVANETNTAYADVVRFAAYVEAFDAVNALVTNDSTDIEDFDVLESAIHEVDQLCLEYNTLKGLIEALPEKHLLLISHQADVALVEKVYRSFLIQNGNDSIADDPILEADLSKLLGCIDRMKEIVFKWTVDQYIWQIEDAAVTAKAYPIDPVAGSVWIKNIDQAVVQAKADFLPLVYNGSYDDATGTLKIDAFAKALEIRDTILARIDYHLNSYIESTTP